MFFSIILTTFNRPRLLEDALASIARQSYGDFEVVVVNDAGMPVEPVLLEYAFPLIYIRLNENQGVAAARNAGLRLATGQYICYLDDDDLYLPNHLQTLADGLTRHPDCVVYCDSEQVKEKLEDHERVVLARMRPYAHDNFDAERLYISNYIPLNSCAHPRATIAKTGEFDPALPALEDWEMLLRLQQHYPFVHLAIVTSEVRQRSQDVAGDHLLERERNQHRVLFEEIYRRHPGSRSEALRRERGRALAVIDNRHAPVSLQQWLDARAPSKARSQLIRQRLQNRGKPISLAIFIHAHDENAPTAALELTLASLARVDKTMLSLQILVIGDTSTAMDLTLEDNSPVRELVVAKPDTAKAINDICQNIDCTGVLQVHAGSEFTAAGLLYAAAELCCEPRPLAICADEMMRTANAELNALLRPDFNLDLLLSMPASHARHWLFNRESFLAAGGLDPSYGDAAELDLLLRLAEHGCLAGLIHIHEPLLITAVQPIRSSVNEIQAITRHLHRRGYEQATVEPSRPGCYRLHYAHPDTPGVSIIIPTRNQFGMLRRCVESLLEKTNYKNYEVLIVDNGSDEADVCTWLNGIEAMASAQLRVLRYPQPFNYSAMNNLAARHARGDYLVLLNNDTAIVRGDWLDALLNHGQRPEVGIVGAKLLYPDSHIQHAGVVLGLRGPAEHVFSGEKLDSPGYMYRAQLDQDYSVVTGACLMIRRSLYEQVGGLDEERFKVSYNDVDLCLKVRRSGHLVVWTPHAVLLHEGSVSQNSIDNDQHKAKLARFRGEQDAMYDKWLAVIADDPAYNRNLSLHGRGFTVETDPIKNWRPLPWRPLPVILTLPADVYGCGHYRIMQPAAAMNAFGLAEVLNSNCYPDPIQMQRYCPEAAVLQRQFTPEKIAVQKRLNRFNNCFKVAELDDYLPNLPLKSAANGLLPRDMLKHMRKALRISDRFIVSTPALAEALHGMHPDIRVVQNHLPLSWWQQQQSLRRQGRKPRVGWGGGSSHRGDLELITDVVRALADEVEWVFFGMCPEVLRPHIHEYHPGVAIADYPQKLASLNLDLALAPLEDNLFNQCKSNLRLLEYGACGYPVVCSDVRPYQGDLPVTRVKPRFKDWVDAIRMHIHDLDAAAATGDSLRQIVLRDWMLDEKHATFWLSQWLPD